MVHPWFIVGQEELIQIAGKTYKIPATVNLISSFGLNVHVKRKTIALAKQFNCEFKGFDIGRECDSCGYGSSKDSCDYETAGIEKGILADRIRVFSDESFFNKLLGRSRKYMAKETPCIVRAAFYTAVLEQKMLEEYLVSDEVSRESFYPQKAVLADKEVLRTVIRQYQRMSK